MCPQRGVAFLGRVLLGVCVGWRMACGAMRIVIRIRCDWLRSQLGFSITPAAMVLSTRMTGWDTSVRDISSLLSFQYIRTNLLGHIRVLMTAHIVDFFAWFYWDPIMSFVQLDYMLPYVQFSLFLARIAYETLQHHLGMRATIQRCASE